MVSLFELSIGMFHCVTGAQRFFNKITFRPINICIMKWIITSLFIISTFCSHAQIFKKILDKTKQKTEERISEKISEKASDAASKPIDDVTTKKEGKKSAKTEENTSAIPGNSKEEQMSLSTYSKYDFVPGEKILVYEDFSQDAIGDFPDKWRNR